MDPQVSLEKPDTKLIVETIIHHLDAGTKADWTMRCSHYVIALRLLQKHSIEHSTGSINKVQHESLAKHVAIMRALMLSVTSVGTPLDAGRMFNAIDFLLRFWVSPRPPTPIEAPQGALLQALVLTNMLETALSFYRLANYDRDLTAQITRERAGVLKALLTDFSVDLQQPGFE